MFPSTAEDLQNWYYARVWWSAGSSFPQQHGSAISRQSPDSCGSSGDNTFTCCSAYCKKGLVPGWSSPEVDCAGGLCFSLLPLQQVGTGWLDAFPCHESWSNKVIFPHLHPKGVVTGRSIKPQDLSPQGVFIQTFYILFVYHGIWAYVKKLLLWYCY